ncbi:hypothetical protein [Ferrimicrobium acidiphilum]|jgi:hypothetical protein|uniref:hypothetical protein n=1 Tax=Ferrimicrobium acidiphilum TaxID=121039 RepID=UPI0023F2577B|nr:hypothetical protein [Ferrimicrobium acidiphilum]
MLDELLSDITRTTAISMHSMVERYADRLDELHQSRDFAYRRLSKNEHYYDDLAAIQRAMIVRAWQLQSFFAYVVYDSGLEFASSALLAAYTERELPRRIYRLLSEPWDYQTQLVS